jgi:hypothetical protein
MGLKEVPTHWKRDCFDYDDSHNACTCLTSENRAEECAMRDPGPQKRLSTRVYTHTHTYTRTYIFKDPVLACSYIHRLIECTSEGSQPVPSYGSLQLQVPDF